MSVKLWLASTLEWIQGTVWAGFTSEIQCYLTALLWGGLACVCCCWFCWFFVVFFNSRDESKNGWRFWKHTHTIPSLWLYYKAHSIDIFCLSTIIWDWWNICEAVILCILCSPIDTVFGQYVFVVHSVWIRCTS